MINYQPTCANHQHVLRGDKAKIQQANVHLGEQSTLRN